MPINNDDNKLAFKEEQANLKYIEGRIDALIKREEAVCTIRQKEINSWFTIDNEDRRNKADLIAEQQKHLDVIDGYRAYIDSPYFGHFEMITKVGEQYSFYVGKEGLGEGSDIIILDWRSPMGNTFYDKRQSHFTIKGKSYDLALRRAVDIKNATLKSVYTEFDLSNLSLEGEIIDEFLISVLRDKRRNYKLTDIIRTIQKNQNDLIGKPIGESFIIQGCAGSGKTMILLHRLSFIAYNHPKTDFSRYFILTPNENFNVHVNELSQSLGLGKTKRYTVEAFYAELIKSRARGDNRVTDPGNKTVPKITASSSSIRSEKLLNPKLLTFIYSERFYNEIIHTYQSKSADAVHELKSLNILEIAKNNNHSVGEITKMDFRTYSALNNSINSIITKHSKAYDELQTVENELNSAKESAAKVSDDASRLRLALTDAKAALLETCEQRIPVLENDLVYWHKELKDQNELVESSNKEKSALQEKLQLLETAPGLADRLMDPSQVYDALSSPEDAAASFVREICDEEYSNVKALREQLTSLALYNFGRRARIRTELHEAEIVLSEKAAASLPLYYNNTGISEDASQLNTRIAELDDLIALAASFITEADSEIHASQAKLVAYRACQNALRRELFPDLSVILSPAVLQLIFGDCKVYSGLLLQNKSTEKELASAKDRVSRMEREAARLNQVILSETDISALRKSLDIVRRFDAEALLSDLETRLKATYARFNQPYSHKANYRHKLYLKLLLCTLYYGTNYGFAQNVSIDEAQDLAPVEYKLLQFILGDKTVFNLYGDVNQAVYEYKGISDWSEISHITSKVYFLNENYRNTLQITEYCNKAFEADVMAVGLSGVDVLTLGFDEAVKKIQRLHKDSPEFRTAIIYKRGLGGFRETIAGRLSSDAAYGTVDVKKISVITVEEAKGLEFDAVLVVDNYMNVNERYIAYTRALDNLVITTLPNAAFDTTTEAREVTETESTETEGKDEFIPEITEEELGEELVIQPAGLFPEDDEPLPTLTKETVDIPLSVGRKYARTFFKDSFSLVSSFVDLAEYVIGTDSDICIRVSTGYIGLAKPDEYCRFYILESAGKMYIKFKHLNAKEEFSPEKINQYKKAYDQCARYVRQYPIKLPSKTASTKK